MKKYIVVTNVWGKKQRGAWDNLVDVFKEEREYFDTKREADDYIALFEEVCKTYDVPAIKSKGSGRRDDIWPNKIFYDFKTANERAWGWVLGDTESCTVLKWGGLSLMNISKKDDIRRVKDYLFRGEDEVPKNYKWDIGEYEGWLQFRWGDRKNALDYVEPEKPKKQPDDVVDFNENEDPWFETEHEDDYEEVEAALKKLDDKELKKKLIDRW